MWHRHRWAPIGVSHMGYSSIFDKPGNGAPVTFPLYRCERCSKFKQGNMLYGHWSSEQLFGKDVIVPFEDTM